MSGGALPLLTTALLRFRAGGDEEPAIEAMAQFVADLHPVLTFTLADLEQLGSPELEAVRRGAVLVRADRMRRLAAAVGPLGYAAAEAEEDGGAAVWNAIAEHGIELLRAQKAAKRGD